jgi:hypothetical protein
MLYLVLGSLYNLKVYSRRCNSKIGCMCRATLYGLLGIIYYNCGSIISQDTDFVPIVKELQGWELFVAVITNRSMSRL